MSLKPSRRGLLIGMGATAADAVLPVQANTRDDPMAYRAAAELVEALAKRRVSSRELVDSAIARIEALDSKINALVVRDFDRARAAAAAADAALAEGDRRPLLGVPITVKEQFGVAGLPTTWGNPKFKDWRPEVDGLDRPAPEYPLLDRIRKAGGTDYFALALNRTFRRFPTVTWATDRPDGFSDADIAKLPLLPRSSDQ
jgi:hypothetical protein